ncbi:DUF397 domain-containing protein [Catellatospora sp. NPDC049111]|uniref:DUF397 domain-containing protein n=1 Tax=Catellatospora sp. NPDC049111 TaxID=3155271 RepID=UPI0033C54A82
MGGCMASDGEQIVWRIGSFCDTAACVEIGIGPDEVLVRRARSESPVVMFTHEEWSAFLRSARAGEFDLS